MSKPLRPSGTDACAAAPMTTALLARRMLGASSLIASNLPAGFYSAPALDILLALHAAEDVAHYPDSATLEVPGVDSADLTDRWIGLLIDGGLVERQGGLLALTSHGHQTIIDLLQQVFDHQRSFD